MPPISRKRCAHDVFVKISMILSTFRMSCVISSMKGVRKLISWGYDTLKRISHRIIFDKVCDIEFKNVSPNIRRKILPKFAQYEIGKGNIM